MGKTKKIILILLIVFLLFFLLNFNKKIIDQKINKNNEKNIKSENGKIEVYFCPKDDCSLKLEEFILSAEESVDCALFDLRLKNIINALASKSKEIKVRVVVDNENEGYVKGVKYDDSNQLSHNKFCVIDGKKVSTGSFNPTERGAFKNNNNLVIIYSEYLAENYLDEFNELWNGKFGEGYVVENPVVYVNNIKIENYFCPEDDCKQKVIETIKGASESIYFMTFSFTDEEIADEILFKDVDIKGVFEKVQAASEYSQYKRMKGFGLDVKIDKNKYNMHHKVFIIDEKIVITGSYNPTGAGTYKNDENLLIIHDKNVAGEYVREFFDLFE